MNVRGELESRSCNNKTFKNSCISEMKLYVQRAFQENKSKAQIKSGLEKLLQKSNFEKHAPRRYQQINSYLNSDQVDTSEVMRKDFVEDFIAQIESTVS